MVILLCNSPGRGVVAVVNCNRNTLKSNQYKREKNGKQQQQEERQYNAQWKNTPKGSPEKKLSSSPFAINCRFSKTFFGLPKKCSECKKLIVGTGFACKNCQFCSHQRCISINQSETHLRPTLCSLSKIPSNDDLMVSRLIENSQLNSGDFGGLFKNPMTKERREQEVSLETQIATPQWDVCESVDQGENATGEQSAEERRRTHSHIFEKQLLKVMAVWKGALESRNTTVKLDKDSALNSEANPLIATWPIGNVAKCTEANEPHWTERGKAELRNTNFNRSNRKSDLQEWTIPSRDLRFEDCILNAESLRVHKGQWHGEVLINCYSVEERMDNNFFRQAQMLNNIRHENIALFMGVIVEPPMYAIVTCGQSNYSLYEYLHIKGSRPVQALKLKIVCQIAQGMSYLHSRGIVLKTLNSKNIVMENKVKIGMIDYALAQSKCKRMDKATVRRGNLTYLSPELMRSLIIQPPNVTVTAKHTKQSDVYSFGTILHEVFLGSYPHCDLQWEQLIWAISNGITTTTSYTMDCRPEIKALLEQCWSPNAAQRPKFVDTANALSNMRLFTRTALQNKRSISVPKNINLLAKA